jgi:putative Mg2+ transporter-C (MgtC) family protein
MDLGTFVTRLGIALVLGTVVGLERQLHHRMAGTRTNALVAAAAGAFTMLGIALGGDGAGRIVGQIVSGVGFLGAGVIFKEGGAVHGLNTAATVWCSASVGALAGSGYPMYALAVAVSVVLTNLALRPLAYRWGPGTTLETSYRLELTCESKDETQLRTLLLPACEKSNLKINSLSSEPLEPGDRVRVSAELKSPVRKDEKVEQVVARVSLAIGVSAVSWRAEPRVAVE